MSTPLGEALRLLGIYTAGRYDIWALAGPRKASCRAHVLSTLLAKSVPQSKAGVNAIRDAFYSACNVTGETINEREENFSAFINKYETAMDEDDPTSVLRRPGLRI